MDEFFNSISANIIAVFLLAVAIPAFLAIIPSSIAKKKGHSGVGFYFFGLFLFIPALIVALCISDVLNNNVTTSFSASDELLKYKSLLDCGAITQEEFDEQKMRLLNSTSERIKK